MIKQIPNYSRYKISDSGELYNTSGRLLSPAVSDRGYFKYPMKADDGTVKTIRIHRLVATVFIENPEGLKEVNHKDGDKLNNRVDNLEWVDRSKNMFHYFSKHGNQWSRKLVLHTELGIFYESATECAKLLGIPKSTLTMMLSNHRENKTPLVYC